MSDEITYVSKDGGPPQPCKDLAYALSLGYRACDPPTVETAPVMIVPDEVPRRTRKPRGGNSVAHE